MCIPSYYKYIFLFLVVGTLVILAVFYDRLFYFIPIFIFSIIWSRIRCPKCGESLLKEKNGWEIGTRRTTCRHCGQETLLCEIEPDEVTQKRLQ